MKTYEFKIYLIGIGENEQEAWDDAVEGFILDPGSPPDEQGACTTLLEFDDA